MGCDAVWGPVEFGIPPGSIPERGAAFSHANPRCQLSRSGVRNGVAGVLGRLGRQSLARTMGNWELTTRPKVESSSPEMAFAFCSLFSPPGFPRSHPSSRFAFSFRSLNAGTNAGCFSASSLPSPHCTQAEICSACRRGGSSALATCQACGKEKNMTGFGVHWT